MKFFPHCNPGKRSCRFGYGRAEKALIVLFSMISILCGLWLVSTETAAAQSRVEVAALASSFRGVPAGSNGSFVPPQESSAVSSTCSENSVKILPQFQTLYAKNPDFAGWLTVEGTAVDYPVMLTPKDPEYYLHRNFDRNGEYRGLPFLDANIDLHNSANYLIYGHNMKDGTVFAALKQYRSEAFFRTHRVIRFDTLYETGRYEVIAAFYSQIYNRDQDVFKYYRFHGPASPAEFSRYIKNVKKLSFYETGVTAEPGDQLLTLSTCSSHTEDGRLAVVARKVTS